MKRYRRIILTIVLLVIMGVALFLGWLNQQTKNAPIQLGGARGTDSNQAQVNEREYSPPPREMLVTTNHDGTWDVMLLTTDGELRNLTNDESGAVDIVGTWSMNGETINFLSNRLNPETVGPAQMAADGSNLRSLTAFQAVMTLFSEQQFDWDPRWSPDDATVLWASVRDLNLELYTIPTDVDFTIQNASRLTESRHREWFHKWSPDGTKIAYSSDADGNENIYILDLETGETTQLTHHEKDDTVPFWTHDGEQIVFVSERDAEFESGILNVYIMSLDGSHQRLIENETISAGLDWSPDGQYISWMEYTSEGYWHIFVSDKDGNNIRRVTDGDGDFVAATWRP